MFGTKTREIERLLEANTLLLGRVEKLRHDVESARNATRFAARAMDEIDAATVAGLEQQVAQKDRQIRLLHKQIDAATGLDRPLVEPKAGLS